LEPTPLLSTSRLSLIFAQTPRTTTYLQGRILQAWRKKSAVALDLAFYHTLPNLPEVDPHEADIAWMIYDLQFIEEENRHQLALQKIIYTQFSTALSRITRAEAGSMDDFLGSLLQRLDEKLDSGDIISSDDPTLADIIQQNELAQEEDM
jgi:hypothetical protein